MEFSKLKFSVLLLLLAALVLGLNFLPQPAAAAFVTCGGSGQAQCTFQDLITVIIRVINYLISMAALVAMYYILLSGWNLIIALGDVEKIQRAKSSIRDAIVGFSIVVLAFVFVNLLVNGLFGSTTGAERKWYDPQCIYLDSSGCPLGASNLR